MKLNTVFVPGSTSRQVTVRFSKASTAEVSTDLWGRMICVRNAEVAKEMWKLCDGGYIKCATATTEWEAIRSRWTMSDAMAYTGAPATTTAAVPTPATAPEAPTPDPTTPDPNTIKMLTKKWFDFFSEFTFRPQARLINSIFGCTTWQNVQELVVGYFALINHPDASAVADKARSAEFKELARSSAEVPMSTVINKRLVLFYGDPGTGKTTKAIEMFPDVAVMPCNPSMLPVDLIREFDFKDDTGKPVFKDSVLVQAMKEGKTVILDEINLLTLECLRSLQAVLDNKTAVTLNGNTVEIKDGFMVVGTMNLDIGGVTYGLPDPLVDRAAVIKKFELSPDEVAKIACPEAF